MRYCMLTVLLTLCLFIPSGNGAETWRQVPGVLHVQTRFDGSGRYSLDQLVAMARDKGIEILIPSDHDYQTMAYGVPPFRNLIKKTESRDSVIRLGAEKYLAEIARANAGQKDVLVVPGVQSSPFYYWSGLPFREDFTANGYRKELMVVGLTRGPDYNRLPVLHGPLSTHYTARLMPRFLVFAGACLLSVVLAVFMGPGPMRYLGIGLALVSAGLALNHHPFQSSLFDPYHGDQGVRPYQELIDYVNQRGGLAFWLHPESNFATTGKQIGPVQFKTPHYTDDLINTTGYAGFEAIYGDTVTMTKPGRQWDQILGQYCRGERAQPVWGFSGADYHGDREGEAIDAFQTIFLLKEKSLEAVLDALKKGRYYALLKSRKEGRMVLERFSVSDEHAGGRAIMGETLRVEKARPVVRCRISGPTGTRHRVKARLIRKGRVLAEFDGTLPMAIEFQDPTPWSGTIYYRIEAGTDGLGRLLSNPIFVQKGHTQ